MKISNKKTKYLSLINLIILSFSSFAQNHRYEKYDNPKSIGLGFKLLLIGGVIWGIGMILGKLLKKDESGTIISEGQKTGMGIVMFITIAGALVAIFGLLMLGF